jgi:hypothetical protein
MIEGSGSAGSIPLTNGSGSDGSGSVTLVRSLCPYLGPVLHTLEDLLLPVAGLVLCPSYLGPVLHTLEDLLLPVAGLVLCRSYLGPVLHTLEDLLLPMAGLVLVLSLQPGLDAPAGDNITYEWWSKTGSGLSRECGSGLTPLFFFRAKKNQGLSCSGAKMIRKSIKKVKIFHVLKCWMFSFES